ncbi:MAG TPA: conjugal transfer protein TraR [Melioribacteraceae bacterium]|nr:conjugal transfer protein TraR [Melioribacteraceae bacterium]
MARCAKKSTEPTAETKKEKTGKKNVGEEALKAENEQVVISEVKEEKPVKKTAKTKEEIKPEKEKKPSKSAKAKTEVQLEEPKKVEESVVVENAVTEAKGEEENLIELMSPTRKIKKIKGYSKKDLEEFKEVILKKREEIIEQIQILKEQMMDPSTGQYVNENSPYSLHMAEQGTDAQEREKLYLWAQRENKFLGYLEDSLVRIENGTYGICIECIDEPQNLCPTCPLIPKERLMAVPHTQHCLQVKTKMQKNKK